MSHQVNDKLVDDARDMAEYWTGTIHEKIILNCLERNDYDGLREALSKAKTDYYEEVV